MTDWMEEDVRQEMTAVNTTKEAQRVAALDFARLHLVFEQDPRAKKLLETWRSQFVEQRVGVLNTIQQYAAYEATRSFVLTILDQLKFAHTEGHTIK